MNCEEDDRKDVLLLRSALKKAGAPLLSAGPGFAGAVAAAAGEGPGLRLPVAGLVLAGGFALLMLFGLPRETRFAPPSAASMTPGFINPFGASVPGEASETDFLKQLSVRAAKEPGSGPAPVNLKEGV